MDSIQKAHLLAKYAQRPICPYGDTHRGVVWMKVTHPDQALGYTRIVLNGSDFRIHGRCSNSRMWTFIDEVLASGIAHVDDNGQLITTTTTHGA